MKKIVLISAALVGAVAVGPVPAFATGTVATGNADFTFSGPGFSGNLSFTYGPSADSVWPGTSATPAYLINPGSVTGTFTDTNNGLGIVAASITGLFPNTTPTGPQGSDNTKGPAQINFIGPVADPNNLLPPDDIVAEVGGFLSFDNLYWPNGTPNPNLSPAPSGAWTGWPFFGGNVDVYGIAFTVTANSNTYDVDLWYNGNGAPPGYRNYGVAVILDPPRELTVVDYVSGSVPEPSTWAMMCLGFASLGFLGYRARKAASIAA